MKIIVAPDSFKHSLRAGGVADAVASGWASVRPEDEILKFPMSDGGEGLCEALCHALSGKMVKISTYDPLMRPRIGTAVVAGDTAVIESAEANGIELLDKTELSPLRCTTFGVGELIKALLLQYHCRNFIIGIGGSATVDGGSGMMQSLGCRFFDQNGGELPPGMGGGDLRRIAAIDKTSMLPELKMIRIKVACDVSNILCGECGSAAVFGPQKGATAEMVRILDENLLHWAKLWNDPGTSSGDGAAGGLGFALRMLGGRMVKGALLVMEETGFLRALDGCDLVITGEGCSDNQTAYGKLCSQIALSAGERGVPTLLLSGALKGDCSELFRLFSGCFSISTGPGTLEEALKNCAANLRDSASALAGFSNIFNRKR